ncbi:MAG TPA: response regulator [Spirochaetia bacterium]|nr:response regulator [Spirochaetia bacterium]
MTRAGRPVLAAAALLALAACVLALLLVDPRLIADVTLQRLAIAALSAATLAAAWILASAIVGAGSKETRQSAPAESPPTGGPPSPSGDIIERFAGGMAHDLNNVLLVLRGYADLALEAHEVGPEARRHLQELLSALGRGSELVGQLSAVARRSGLRLLPLDVNSAVAHALQAPALSTGVRFRPAAGLPPVRAAGELMDRLLTYLAGYALQGMPPGDSVSVETEAGGPDASGATRVTLRVTCPGRAVGDDEIKRLFEPFPPLAPDGKKVGLVLAAARGIVLFLGGRIEAHAPAAGGVVFTISFPAAASEAVTSAPAGGAREVADAPGATILLAEDDRSIRDLAERVLKKEGFVVLAAADGEEALRLFERNADAVRLALLDDVMPKLGGRAVLEKMRALKPGLPAVLCTGYSWTRGQPAAGADGEELLPKPYEPREMLRRVRRLLG